ncbi:MAG: hypothetical protein WBN82_01755 [Porticoccaceae bacterium]
MAQDESDPKRPLHLTQGRKRHHCHQRQRKNTVQQPLRAGKTQKAIFITSSTLTQAGLVQQTVQIVARFAHTI